jgi:nitric oxide reductase activation protein
MSDIITTRSARTTSDSLPSELLELRDRVQAQPANVRAELEPLLDDVLEHALFRGRIISVARDALERLRLDLDMALFDLDATRRERETLRTLLGDRN